MPARPASAGHDHGGVVARAGEVAEQDGADHGGMAQRAGPGRCRGTSGRRDRRSGPRAGRPAGTGSRTPTTRRASWPRVPLLETMRREPVAARPRPRCCRGPPSARPPAAGRASATAPAAPRVSRSAGMQTVEEVDRREAAGTVEQLHGAASRLGRAQAVAEAVDEQERAPPGRSCQPRRRRRPARPRTPRRPRRCPSRPRPRASPRAEPRSGPPPRCRRPASSSTSKLSASRDIAPRPVPELPAVEYPSRSAAATLGHARPAVERERDPGRAGRPPRWLARGASPSSRA